MKKPRVIEPMQFIDELIQFIEAEQKKYSLWAFLNQHGGNVHTSYHGYCQALDDIHVQTVGQYVEKTTPYIRLYGC
ncbi:hypothetical protein [Brevibacillus laterosporus]